MKTIDDCFLKLYFNNKIYNFLIFVMEKRKAASEFNAYVKSKKASIIPILELGLTEKNIREKYLGTIFTK